MNGSRSSGRRSLKRAGVILLASATVIVIGLATIAQAAGTLGSGFTIDGVVPDAGTTLFSDPAGSVQELSPENAATTKLGNIQTDALPTLAYTDQNPGNDLSGVWLATNVDANGKVWLYFAFKRDASSTGQVVFEFDANAAPAACDYSGVNLTDPPGATNTATQDLIANCNPWKNRATGDFSFAFDTQGSGVNIVKRVFTGSGFTTTTLDGTVSAAAIAANGLTGEGIVNLSDTVFPATQTSCLTTANILPYSITGNSDSADMKDVVLSDFTDRVSVSSCGEVRVTKATDPTGGTGTFPYTLSRSDSSALKYSGATSVTGSLTGDGDSDLITDLKTGTNYTLAEGSVGPTYALQTIACTTDGTNYNVYPGAADFTVQTSTITECTITNKLQTGTIKVIKHVVGGSASASDFTMSLNDSASTSFAGSETGTTTTLTDGTTYNVTESGPNGYTASKSGDCSGSIVAGQNKTCTVTNTLDTGSLKISKTLDTGGSNFDTTTQFDINYNCGGTFTGTVHVAGGSSTTVNGIPAGSSCTVTEPTQPAAPAGYSWSAADITGSPASITKGGTANVTVANALTRDKGSLGIAKTLNDGGSGFSGSFTIHYSCTDGTQGNATVAGGGNATINNIPTGTVCTVTEPTQPTAPIGYVWSAPTFSPSNGQVTITTKATTYTVTVTNTLTPNTRDFPPAKVTPTGTTCQNYRDHTAGDLSQVTYQVKGGKVYSVSPGVFFYYTGLTAPSSSFTLAVGQTNNGGWPAIDAQTVGQIVLYDATCTKTTAQGTTTFVNGTATITVSGATPGAVYFIGIKYNPGSLIGFQPGGHPTVTYTFSLRINGSFIPTSVETVDLKFKK